MPLVKTLISSNFDVKKGVFETLWLSLQHWNKLGIMSLKKLVYDEKEE
jgi:hypothetical protein